LRTAQSTGILVTRGEGGHFEVFPPLGRHVAPIRMKYGVEESTESTPPHQISPQSGQGWGLGPKTENFTQISAYKRPTGAHPLGDFTEFSQFVGSFMFGQVKFGQIRSRGFPWFGDLSLGVCMFTKFSVPPSCETMRRGKHRL